MSCHALSVHGFDLWCRLYVSAKGKWVALGEWHQPYEEEDYYCDNNCGAKLTANDN